MPPSLFPQSSAPSASQNQPRDDDNNKNMKESIVLYGCQLGQEMICPITLHLPWDPVTAGDGRIYERAAIEQHIQSAHDAQTIIKSPYTMQPMDDTLLPAPQIKNIIEISIANGFITGDLANKWQQKEQQKKNMEHLLKQAQQGDVTAMETVAFNYQTGLDGFPENEQEAFVWYEIAHQAGSIIGTACFGECLLKGMGVTQNAPKGFILLGIAAGQGSDLASQQIGLCYAEGRYDLPVDHSEAIKWLQRALSGTCPIRQPQLGEYGLRIARETLDRLTAPAATTIRF